MKLKARTKKYPLAWKVQLPLYVAVFFTTLLLSSQRANAQYFKIEEHTGRHSSGELYKFPILTSNTNPQAGAAINKHVQQAQLELQIARNGKGAFVNLWPADAEAMRGTHDYFYRVISNNERYFSIEFGGEGCGAYCETYSMSYNYFSANGTFIELKDLFSNEALNFLDLAVYYQQTKQMQNTIAALKKDDQDEHTKEAIALFEDCIKERKERNVYNIRNSDYYLTDSAITIASGRCSNHAMRALDEIGDFENVVELTTIEPLLTTRAKEIFKLPVKREDGFKEYSFHGTINKTIKVHLFIKVNENTGEVIGSYYYDKFGQFIALNGTKKGRELTFFEKDKAGKITAKFSATQTNTTLSGTWTNLQKSRSYPLSLDVVE